MKEEEELLEYLANNNIPPELVLEYIQMTQEVLAKLQLARLIISQPVELKL